MSAETEIMKYLDPNLRICQADLIHFLLPGNKEISEGMCAAITCMYLLYAVNVPNQSGPVRAFQETKSVFCIKDVYEYIAEKQQLFKEMDITIENFEVISENFAGGYMQLNIQGGIALYNIPTSNAISNIIKDPTIMDESIAAMLNTAQLIMPSGVQFAFCVFNCRGGAHAVAFAQMGNFYYLFDCNYGLFAIPKPKFKEFINNYCEVYGITALRVSAVNFV